ncbi:MAG TPA: hypothetical protein VF605_11665 [Allosphingosinicella sp.]|jgi:hypothetical protein
MTVDLEFARWLKEGVKFASADDAGVAAKFGALGRSTEIQSPLALLAGATAEAARQVAFLAGPLVVDTHLVDGLRADLLGQPVTIQADRLGYDAGVVVFVIGVEELAAVDQTTLTVLRKLT